MAVGERRRRRRPGGGRGGARAVWEFGAEQCCAEMGKPTAAAALRAFGAENRLHRFFSDRAAPTSLGTSLPPPQLPGGCSASVETEGKRPHSPTLQS